MRKPYLLGSTFAAIVCFLFSSAVSAVEVNVLAKVSDFGYALELEIQDFANASAIDLVHPDPDIGTLPLIFDSGENNWDVEAEGLTLSGVGDFFDTTFDFVITHSGGSSIYTAERYGPPGSDQFPTRATSLTISPSANPLRPTASWTGGDDSADAMIITYQLGDDEFTDGFEAPEIDGMRTLGQDLAPGTYEVALGFYYLFNPFSLSITSGDDVLGVSEINPFTVGETFSSTTVVPIPPAVWLFGAGLLSLFGIARKKKVV